MLFSAGKRKKAANQAWQEAAKLLGLRYTEQGRKRRLKGDYRGFSVRVETFTPKSKDNSQLYTRYQVRYPDLGLGLKLKHQSIFATLGRALSGGKDITIGNREYDEAVIVEANLAREVITFLTPERQKLTLDLITSREQAIVGDMETSIATRGTETKARKMQLHLDELVVFAASLSNQEPSVQRPSATLLEHSARTQESQPNSSFNPVGTAVHAGQGEQAAADLKTDLGFDPALLVPPAVVRSPEPDPVPVASPVEAPPSMESRSATEVPTPSLAPEPEPAPPEPQSNAAPIDYRELRTDLFETSRMSFEVKEHFEITYAGRVPTWRGKLERLSDYNSDMVFDGGPGTKATVQLEPIQDGSFAKDVRAIVQLSREQAESARAIVGSEVTLTGRLISCDAFMRNLFLADGSLTKGEE